MVPELEHMKHRHRQTIMLEVVLGLLGLILFFYGLIWSLGSFFLSIVLLGAASYFDWQRKRLERKIDTAEGVMAAKRAGRRG